MTALAPDALKLKIDADAKLAARHLITRANRTLMAGLRPDEVETLWAIPLRLPTRTKRRK
jgi:hypothetical protein